MCCSDGNLVREKHQQRLAALRTQGVKRVFLVVCDKPQAPCRAVARHIWPIEEVPDLPQGECAWSSPAREGVWEGCEYFPYFGALVAPTVR